MLNSEHAGKDPLPAALRRSGIPFVIGGRSLAPDAPACYVDNGNVGRARLAVERLLGQGRTVIGSVAGP